MILRSSKLAVNVSKLVKCAEIASLKATRESVWWSILDGGLLINNPHRQDV